MLIGGIVGTGTSNLGAFTTAESNCLNPITGSLFNGLFTFGFAGVGRIYGTTTNVFEYLTTGGTGLYAGATGPDNTTGNTFTYAGSFGTVPEPSTLAAVGAGLVGIGVTVRRRRRSATRA